MTNEVVDSLKRIESELAETQSSLLAPEMMTSYHHGEYYLSGNSSAYVALAIRMLKASQGRDVNFSDLSWLSGESWQFTGLFAVAELSSKVRSQARFRWKWKSSNIKMLVTAGLLLSLALIGLYTVADWLLR